MKVVTADGATIDLGTTETTPTISITDYSRRVTDDFGVTTVVERGFARRMSVRLAVPFDGVDAIQRRLADLRATSALWVADDRFAWLSVRGFYKDFDLDLAVPPLSFCSLTVEGLAETEVAADPGGDPAPLGHASTLQLLQPAAIGEGQLIASSVAENDAPAWAPGITYAKGDRAIRAHRVYESLIAANTGQQPGAAPAAWLDTGPTSRWAMFDEAMGTATEAAGQIVVRIAAGSPRALALLDTVAATVRVQAPGYERSRAIGGGAVTFLDLPGVSGEVTVTIVGPGTVSVGTLLIGSLVSLGATEASPTAGITDFSRKDVDDFGEVTIVKRGFAKRMTARALIRTDAVDAVADRIARVRARPALWIGQDGSDALTVFGFFKDFSIEAGENVSKLALSVEGLSAAVKLEPLKVPVTWEEIEDPKGTKPKDNATNSADPDSPFGPDGTVKEAIATLERIDPIEVKTELLNLIQADQAAAIRQAARDNATLARALLRATDELNRTREVFRDAGVTVNPTTGEVRIYAVDQVADRTSQAEIRLNAVQSSLNLRVTLDQLNEAILKAQLDPSGQVDVDAIFSRLTNVEIGLDGVRATLLLKADATTVTALGGVVTSVSQSLDALAGVVETKASSTAVSGLTERVGSVEQTIRTLGDVSSMSVELRQARIAVGKAGQALLAGVVANEEANARQVLALSQARQELQTFTTEGLKAEAFARTLLTARVGGTEASLATEIRVRAEQNAALTQSITEQGVRIGQVDATIVAVQKAQADDRTANAQAIEQLLAGIAAADGKAVAVDARVTRLAETSASEDAALARLIQQVSARISGLGEVGLEQAFQAVVSRLGKIEGRYTVTIDANGNLNGFQLIGSDAGPGTLNLINTDLRMGSGRIILATPDSMLAIGLGFGAQKDLLLWYGPRIALDDCSRSNARMHLPTVGQAYFGGGLSAGKMSTPGETPSLAADAVATVPWFGSDGRPVQYVCAWSYRSTFERVYPPTAEGRAAYDQDVAAYNATGDAFQTFGQKTVEQPRSTVTLSRTFDGNTYTQLEQVGFTTQRLTFRGIAPSVGDAPGRGTFTTDIGGGFTTRDPVQSTGNRALRLSLSRGFNLGVDGVVQRLSIVAVEE